MTEEIILRIGFEQLPTFVGAALLAAGAAIIISTRNTFLMVTSTNVARDIVQAYLWRDPAGFIRLQRHIVIGVGVLAYL